MVSSEKSPVNISNAEFLSQIFTDLEQGEHLWVAQFEGDPGRAGRLWRGQAVETSGEVADLPDVNAYFSTATFAQSSTGSLNRDITHFAGLHCVFVDDATLSTLPLDPTWVLETSPGRFHAGYILRPPLRDLDAAARVVAAVQGWAAAGGGDMSGNNAVRYGRLPVGYHGGRGGPVTVREWTPERRYTAGELLEALSAEFTQHAEQTRAMSRSGREAAVERALRGEAVHAGVVALTWDLTTAEDHVIIAERARLVRAIAEARGPERARAVGAEFDRALRGARTLQLRRLVAERAPALDAEGHPWRLERAQPRTRGLPRAPLFVIDRLIPEGISLFVGAAGIGKTSCVVPLAALTAGLAHPEWGWSLNIPHRRRVVLVTEDTEQVHRVLDAMVAAGALVDDLDEHDEWLRVIPAARIPAEHVRGVAGQWAQLRVDAHGEVFAPWVVLDTASATIDTEDENSNSQTARAIAALKTELFQNHSIPVTVVGHPPKGSTGPSSMRGAGAWGADVQSEVFAYKDHDTLMVEVGKNRWDEPERHYRVERTQREMDAVGRFGEVTRVWASFNCIHRMTTVELAQTRESSAPDTVGALSAAVLEALRTKGGYHSASALSKLVRETNSIQFSNATLDPALETLESAGLVVRERTRSGWRIGLSGTSP